MKAAIFANNSRLGCCATKFEAASLAVALELASESCRVSELLHAVQAL